MAITPTTPTNPPGQILHEALTAVDTSLCIFSNLSGKEVAIASSVCKAFRAAIGVDAELLRRRNFAKCERYEQYRQYEQYERIGASQRHFSTPTMQRDNSIGIKVLTHKDLFTLATGFKTIGNQTAAVSTLLGRETPWYPGYTRGTEIPGTNITWGDPFSPSSVTSKDIIAQIPDKEIGQVYLHIANIIGTPGDFIRGKRAFHDRDGLKSTPAQKAEALQRFLWEKSQVRPSSKELTSSFRRFRWDL